MGEKVASILIEGTGVIAADMDGRSDSNGDGRRVVSDGRDVNDTDGTGICDGSSENEGSIETEDPTLIDGSNDAGGMTVKGGTDVTAGGVDRAGTIETVGSVVMDGTIDAGGMVGTNETGGSGVAVGSMTIGVTDAEGRRVDGGCGEDERAGGRKENDGSSVTSIDTEATGVMEIIDGAGGGGE